MKRTLIFAALLATLVSPAAAHAKRYNLLLDFGQDVLVVGKDDVGVRAQCVQNDGGFDLVRLYAVTANNAVMHGAFAGYPGNGNYLTGVTPVISSMLGAGGASTGQENFSAMIDGGKVLNLTSMHGYTVNLESTVFGVNAGPSDCTLSVDIREVKKFKETF